MFWGATLEEEEKFKEAGVAYDLFLKNFLGAAYAPKFRMRKAETILKDGKFEQAAQMFAEVAAVEGFSHATHARLRQASCLVSLDSLMMRQRFTNPSLKQLPMRTIKKTAVVQLNLLCRKYIDKKLYDKSLALAEQMVSKADTEDLKSDSRWPQRIHSMGKPSMSKLAPDTLRL